MSREKSLHFNELWLCCYNVPLFKRTSKLLSVPCCTCDLIAAVAIFRLMHVVAPHNLHDVFILACFTFICIFKHHFGLISELVHCQSKRWTLYQFWVVLLHKRLSFWSRLNLITQPIVRSIRRHRHVKNHFVLPLKNNKVEFPFELKWAHDLLTAFSLRGILLILHRRISETPVN